MIKYLIFSFFLLGELFSEGKEASVSSPSIQSPMHKLQQRHPDKLPSEQRHVMEMLSSSYQRIYLYALTDDERSEVAIYEQRGQNPYEAIDTILRRDRELSDKDFHKNSSASYKAKCNLARSRYINSNKEVVLDADEEGVLNEPSENVEIYKDQEENNTSLKNLSIKSSNSNKKVATESKKTCLGCSKCKKSFFTKCKEYLSPEIKQEPCKKYKYIDPNTEKRRQRSKQITTY